ncbi:MAG: hypothetical protein COB36_09995 [Alphaproteobacteria bacterium]|nr:MAG: hypothetical protein COB36_09995 [Alphaproteobacteria bacterium]
MRLKAGSPSKLDQRLARVAAGSQSSALDDFIGNRIPFQLGGMSDPFTKIENDEGITLQYLEILQKHHYPVVLSTKSSLVAEERYLSVLKESNAYVRFSTTVVEPSKRNLIDKGCSTMSEILVASERLAKNGIPVCFRFQPIIPGHERHARQLVENARDSGVKHISAEYLKLPLEADRNFGKDLREMLHNRPIQTYLDMNAVKVGAEYSLPLSYRADHLIELAVSSKKNGLTFGFADNDLLVHSDGNTCCSASDLYLEEAGFFNANVVSLAKSKEIGGLLEFSEFQACFLPKHRISTYLNSKSRIPLSNIEGGDWMEYLEKIWAGRHGPYPPIYFDGVEDSGKKDVLDRIIYQRTESDFEAVYKNALAS